LGSKDAKDVELGGMGFGFVEIIEVGALPKEALA
jgi:hypothetical protein